MIEIVELEEGLKALEHYSDTAVSSTVRRMDDLSAAALAQIETLRDQWWVVRVVIRSPQARGQGLGSIALQRALARVAKVTNLPVYVTPGGYEGNTEQQFRFYLKNGFTRIEGDSEKLVWTATGVGGRQTETDPAQTLATAQP